MSDAVDGLTRFRRALAAGRRLPKQKVDEADAAGAADDAMVVLTELMHSSVVKARELWPRLQQRALSADELMQIDDELVTALAVVNECADALQYMSKRMLDIMATAISVSAVVSCADGAAVRSLVDELAEAERRERECS